MPAGLAKLVGKKGVNWDYSTAPEANLDGRMLWWPRGKVLGGSSSINAMCYIRGHQRDYDEWAELGAAGWHWDAVLPYFRRRGQWPQRRCLHGGDGRSASATCATPTRCRRSSPTPPTRPVFRATPFNGPDRGIGSPGHPARLAILRGGLPDPAKSRPNLAVHTGALVERISFDGRRASGVRCTARRRPERWQPRGDPVRRRDTRRRP
jgi:choline dehydrogenase